MTRRLRLGRLPLVPPLAKGYALRTTRPDELRDCERIAGLLNAAFGRTFHTAEEYGAFTRMAPSFAADLDLVAVAPGAAGRERPLRRARAHRGIQVVHLEDDHLNSSGEARG